MCSNVSTSSVFSVVSFRHWWFLNLFYYYCSHVFLVWQFCNVVFKCNKFSIWDTISMIWLKLTQIFYKFVRNFIQRLQAIPSLSYDSLQMIWNTFYCLNLTLLFVFYFQIFKSIIFFFIKFYTFLIYFL